MTDTTALDELIEAVEKGTAAKNYEGWMHLPVKDLGGGRFRQFLGKAWDAYHGSLDAAKALHDALLPCWSIFIHGGHHGHHDYGAQVERVLPDNQRLRGNGKANNPARAWLLAILLAYRAQIGGAA